MTDKFCFVFSNNSSSPTGSMPLSKEGYVLFFNSITSVIKKIIRKIAKKFNCYHEGFARILWGIDPDKLNSSLYIVVFDIAIEPYFCNFIEHNYSDKKLILYYWNTIRNDRPKENEITYYRSKWEIFSFDEQDCLTYHLKYNPDFLAAPYLIGKNQESVEIASPLPRVFFIGGIKDRKERLLLLKKKFDMLNIKNEIIIVDTNDRNCSFMPYMDILTEVRKSSILLDVVKEGQVGLTQRELEALYFHKKLITDNQHIKSRKYYDTNNIFIIDYSRENILEGITDFLSLPYVPLKKEIIDFYSMENWLMRFEN
jgi:hypothetical protein